MTTVVTDTSALISLGGTKTADILDVLTEEYELLVPKEVLGELKETASYSDEQARAAEEALSHVDETHTRETELDSEFPLGEGENAAVALANKERADILLCDEFNQLGLIHASLSDVRLVTTPKLLELLVYKGSLSRPDTVVVLDEISELTTWEKNSYVHRARETLEDSE